MSCQLTRCVTNERKYFAGLFLALSRPNVRPVSLCSVVFRMPNRESTPNNCVNHKFTATHWSSIGARAFVSLRVTVCMCVRAAHERVSRQRKGKHWNNLFVVDRRRCFFYYYFSFFFSLILFSDVLQPWTESTASNYNYNNNSRYARRPILTRIHCINDTNDCHRCCCGCAYEIVCTQMDRCRSIHFRIFAARTSLVRFSLPHTLTNENTERFSSQ